MKLGKVYLVGAGPGDPGLLTLRGRECLEEADVVIHDYLVDPRLLRFVREGSTVVPSGKRGDASQRDRQQQVIHERMIEEARAGRIVVRLKGGDPFVFGRGGEEAEALASAGIPFEVVPGVSSALAAPAYAGIPLTERGINSSFTVVTGHEAPGSRPVDYAALARLETVVFLMGLREIRGVLARLAAAGKDPATPAACVRSGTRPDQRVIVATVGDLAEHVERAGFAPPAVVIVGEVVRRRERIAWFERRPLVGRCILITRPIEQARGFVATLERLGAAVIASPAIVVEPVADPQELDRAIVDLDGFDWVIFTSRTGVDLFFDRLMAVGRDVRALGRAKLAAIGPATADALLTRGGLRADVVPTDFRAEGLSAALAGEVRGRRVLLPRAAAARDLLPTALAAAGAEVVDVSTYRSVNAAALAGEAAAALDEGRVDAVTFTSSSTVRGFLSLLGPRAIERVGRARIASIGPITSATAREAGLAVDVEAREYTTDGLAAALVDYFGAGR